jgi:hypothetical protein
MNRCKIKPKNNANISINEQPICFKSSIRDKSYTKAAMLISRTISLTRKVAKLIKTKAALKFQWTSHLQQRLQISYSTYTKATMQMSMSATVTWKATKLHPQNLFQSDFRFNLHESYNANKHDKDCDQKGGSRKRLDGVAVDCAVDGIADHGDDGFHGAQHGW